MLLIRRRELLDLPNLPLTRLCKLDGRVQLLEFFILNTFIDNLGAVLQLLLTEILRFIRYNLNTIIILGGGIILVDDCFVLFDRCSDYMLPNFFSLVLVAEQELAEHHVIRLLNGVVLVLIFQYAVPVVVVVLVKYISRDLHLLLQKNTIIFIFLFLFERGVL